MSGAESPPKPPDLSAPGPSPQEKVEAFGALDVSIRSSSLRRPVDGQIDGYSSTTLDYQRLSSRAHTMGHMSARDFQPSASSSIGAAAISPYGGGGNIGRIDPPQTFRDHMCGGNYGRRDLPPCGAVEGAPRLLEGKTLQRTSGGQLHGARNHMKTDENHASGRGHVPTWSATPSSVSLASTLPAPSVQESLILDAEIAEQTALLKALEKDLGTKFEENPRGKDGLEQAVLREIESYRIYNANISQTNERDTKRRYIKEARPVTKRTLELKKALKETAEAKLAATEKFKEIRRQKLLLEERIHALEDPNGAKKGVEYEDVYEAFKEAKSIKQLQSETNEALEHNEEEKESHLHRLKGEAREKEGEANRLNTRHRHYKDIFEGLKKDIEGKEKQHALLMQERSSEETENSEKIPKDIEALTEEINNKLKPGNRILATKKNREIKNLHEAMHTKGLSWEHIEDSLKKDEVAKLYTKINHMKMELAMLKSWNTAIR